MPLTHAQQRAKILKEIDTLVKSGVLSGFFFNNQKSLDEASRKKFEKAYKKLNDYCQQLSTLSDKNPLPEQLNPLVDENNTTLLQYLALNAVKLEENRVAAISKSNMTANEREKIKAQKEARELSKQSQSYSLFFIALYKHLYGNIEEDIIFSHPEPNKDKPDNYERRTARKIFDQEFTKIQFPISEKNAGELSELPSQKRYASTAQLRALQQRTLAQKSKPLEETKNTAAVTDAPAVSSASSAEAVDHEYVPPRWQNMGVDYVEISSQLSQQQMVNQAVIKINGLGTYNEVGTTDAPVSVVRENFAQVVVTYNRATNKHNTKFSLKLFVDERIQIPIRLLRQLIRVLEKNPALSAVDIKKYRDILDKAYQAHTIKEQYEILQGEIENLNSLLNDHLAPIVLPMYKGLSQKELPKNQNTSIILDSKTFQYIVAHYNDIKRTITNNTENKYLSKIHYERVTMPGHGSFHYFKHKNLTPNRYKDLLNTESLKYTTQEIKKIEAIKGPKIILVNDSAANSTKTIIVPGASSTSTAPKTEEFELHQLAAKRLKLLLNNSTGEKQKNIKEAINLIYDQLYVPQFVNPERRNLFARHFLVQNDGKWLQSIEKTDLNQLNIWLSWFRNGIAQNDLPFLEAVLCQANASFNFIPFCQKFKNTMEAIRSAIGDTAINLAALEDNYGELTLEQLDVISLSLTHTKNIRVQQQNIYDLNGITIKYVEEAFRLGYQFIHEDLLLLNDTRPIHVNFEDLFLADNLNNPDIFWARILGYIARRPQIDVNINELRDTIYSILDREPSQKQLKALQAVLKVLQPSANENYDQLELEDIKTRLRDGEKYKIELETVGLTTTLLSFRNSEDQDLTDAEQITKDTRVSDDQKQVVLKAKQHLEAIKRLEKDQVDAQKQGNPEKRKPIDESKVSASIAEIKSNLQILEAAISFLPPAEQELLQAYNKVKNFCSENCELEQDALSAKIQHLRQKIKDEFEREVKQNGNLAIHDLSEDQLKLLALNIIAYAKFHNIVPYREQVFTLLKMLQNDAYLNVDTSEGKTYTFGIFALTRAAHGKVVVHTHNEPSAILATQLLEPVAHSINLSVAHPHQGEDENAGAADILYVCALKSMIYHQQRDKKQPGAGPLRNQAKGSVKTIAVDEGDHNSADIAKVSGLVAEVDKDEDEELRNKLYNHIFKALTDFANRNRDLKDSNDLTEEYKHVALEIGIRIASDAPLKNYINTKFNLSAENNLENNSDFQELVKSAIAAKKKKCNEDYFLILDGDKFIVHIVQDTSGRIDDANSQWSKGLHEFVAIKENLKRKLGETQVAIPKPTKVIARTDVQHDFKENYNHGTNKGIRIVSLTGSQGVREDVEFTKSIFGMTDATVQMAPRHNPNQQFAFAPLIKRTELEQFETIYQAMVYAQTSGKRSVLIGFDTIAQCNKFHEFLLKKPNNEIEQLILNFTIFDDTNSHADDANLRPKEEVVIQFTGPLDKILAGTPAIGRASDFKEVDEVILTSPWLKRQMIQHAGRGGRQGALATFQEIYHYAQIKGMDEFYQQTLEIQKNKETIHKLLKEIRDVTTVIDTSRTVIKQHTNFFGFMDDDAKREEVRLKQNIKLRKNKIDEMDRLVAMTRPLEENRKKNKHAAIKAAKTRILYSELVAYEERITEIKNDLILIANIISKKTINLGDIDANGSENLKAFQQGILKTIEQRAQQRQELLKKQKDLKNELAYLEKRKLANEETLVGKKRPWWWGYKDWQNKLMKVRDEAATYLSFISKTRDMVDKKLSERATAHTANAKAALEHSSKQIEELEKQQAPLPLSPVSSVDIASPTGSDTSRQRRRSASVSHSKISSSTYPSPRTSSASTTENSSSSSSSGGSTPPVSINEGKQRRHSIAGVASTFSIQMRTGQLTTAAAPPPPTTPVPT